VAYWSAQQLWIHEKCQGQDTTEQLKSVDTSFIMALQITKSPNEIDENYRASQEVGCGIIQNQRLIESCWDTPSKRSSGDK
jgi:hypothetical protein